MDYPITWNVKEFVGVTVAFLKQFHLKKVLVLGPFLNTKRHTKTGTQAGTPAHGQNHLHAGTWTDSLARRHMDRITHTHILTLSLCSGNGVVVCRSTLWAHHWGHSLHRSLLSSRNDCVSYSPSCSSTASQTPLRSSLHPHRTCRSQRGLPCTR